MRGNTAVGVPADDLEMGAGRIEVVRHAAERDVALAHVVTSRGGWLLSHPPLPFSPKSDPRRAQTTPNRPPLVCFRLSSGAIRALVVLPCTQDLSLCAKHLLSKASQGGDDRTHRRHGHRGREPTAEFDGAALRQSYRAYGR